MSGNLRLWGIGCGIATVALLAGGFFLGVQPALAAADETDAQTTGLAAQNQSSMLTLGALSRQGAKLENMELQQKVLLKAVPSILKPNTFIRRVNEVAAIDNVTVQEVVPSVALPYVVPASAASSSTAVATNGGSDAAPSAAPAASSAATVGVSDPSITPSNFALVPVSVQVNGTESALMQFAHDIQLDERVFLVSNISSATADDGTVSMTLGGYIYALQR